MTRKKTRSVDELLERRIQAWTRPADEERMRRKIPIHPNVAVTHAVGALGEEIAQGVAQELAFRHYDREIVDLVADRARASRELAEALDEQLQSHVDRYVTSVLKAQYLDPDQYFRALCQAIVALAADGGAVIVGRGAGLFLDRSRTLTVRIDAPLEIRCQRYAERTKVSQEEARARVSQRDANRAAFFRKQFHVSWQDPMLYDIVLNTARIDVPGAIRTLVELTEARFPGLEIRR